jgi:hypothetical protein
MIASFLGITPFTLSRLRVRDKHKYQRTFERGAASVEMGSIQTFTASPQSCPTASIRPTRTALCGHPTHSLTAAIAARFADIGRKLAVLHLLADRARFGCFPPRVADLQGSLAPCVPRSGRKCWFRLPSFLSGLISTPLKREPHQAKIQI